MYLRHFSLREAPFSITPDASYFYPHEGAQAALNTLLVAIRGGEGFLKIVGEVGCGKTVLCRQLLRSLQGECVTAYIPNPDLGPRDLLLVLAQELGLKLPASATRHRLLDSLQGCLVAHATQGRQVVVIIDEAQAIPVRTVESLRLLSNLETEKRKLLQIVLLGQPELDRKLARPEIRQLLQRITFSDHLGPMAPARVGPYLRHRMQIAALDARTKVDVFDASAVQTLAQCSGGIPRLVNVLANKCLLLAFGENRHQVTQADVRLAARDTGGVDAAAATATSWWDRLVSGRFRAQGASAGPSASLPEPAATPRARQ
jgi:MSHA biogenesis protein MshM